MARTHEEEKKQLSLAFALTESPDEAEALLNDILSPHELAAAAQRLEVARLLAKGLSYVEVSSLTGASSTTVSRVSKCLNGTDGGYRAVLARLAKKSQGI